MHKPYFLLEYHKPLLRQRNCSLVPLQHIPIQALSSNVTARFKTAGHKFQTDPSMPKMRFGANKTARIPIRGRIQKLPQRVENETRSPSFLVLVTLPSKSNVPSASVAAQSITANDFSNFNVLLTVHLSTILVTDQST